jgi:hypothetical protein
MKSHVALLSILAFVCQSALAQKAEVPLASQQIAAAVLPLPEPLRAQATVLGYSSDLALITLRAGTNGIVCTATRPGDKDFDVRCYQESFMPIVRRLRELHAQGLSQKEINHIVDAEIQSKKLPLPAAPVAGYRMLGPISAYSPATNFVGPEIESWQSIHFPYKTAAEIGLPEEGKVPRAFPYVMGSGTFWSHVMIEHERAPSRDR